MFVDRVKFIFTMSFALIAVFSEAVKVWQVESPKFPKVAKTPCRTNPAPTEQQTFTESTKTSRGAFYIKLETVRKKLLF